MLNNVLKFRSFDARDILNVIPDVEQYAGPQPDHHHDHDNHNFLSL